MNPQVQSFNRLLDFGLSMFGSSTREKVNTIMEVKCPYCGAVPPKGEEDYLFENRMCLRCEDIAWDVHVEAKGEAND